MGNLAMEKLTLLSKLKSIRWATLFLGFSNFALIFVGGLLMIFLFPTCGHGEIFPFVVVVIGSGIRIVWMIGAGIAQEATAITILGQQQPESSVVDTVIRHERRMRYKRWLWWTRFGTAITILQFAGAAYLLFVIVKSVSYDAKPSGCFLGRDTNRKGWEKILVVAFVIMPWFLVIMQCFMGSDVLRWRSFYATHDDAWKAHYREVFDHGIREALCCLGRLKYMSTSEEDEVYSVARVLGDLVAYRALGTGHLELLAGLALMQRHGESTNSCEELMEAPESQIQEALIFHPFAEAAYTGPLLDFGRNPVLFPCVWLYRQGILSPWSRNRRPVLEGDNWWRGHAAAFLKYLNLPPEALKRGRIIQEKREAAYFVVVLHHLRSVVIAVRGTETPEDLLTDGLCRECPLSMEDVEGLIKSEYIAPEVKQSVLSSFPHYGHSGIVESARELFLQLDGQPEDQGYLSSETTGFLSSLLGAGSECHGYNLYIVGHSLGGAVATLLGLRLYCRFPNLHVYTYGTLPCVDFIVAEACSSFVTSIVYNDEFSSRLSVSSILRLRAAAIAALSQDSSANSAMIFKLARQILSANKNHENGEDGRVPTPSIQSATITADDNDQKYRRRHYKYATKGVGEPSQQLLTHESGMLFSNDKDAEVLEDGFDGYNHRERINACHDFNEVDDCDPLNMYIHPNFETDSNGISCDPVSQIVDGVSSSVKVLNGEHPEMYLPGLVIHMVPEQRQSLVTLWKSWKVNAGENRLRAYIASRESFKDIIVSPFMFLDHLPWRCHYAMQRVLETRKAQSQVVGDLPKESHIV